MIQLEKQVCTVSQALKLKELGVKQESYFAYSWAGDNQQKKDSRKRAEYLTPLSNAAAYMSPERCAWGWGITACAFTCAELGVMLVAVEDKEYENAEYASVHYYHHGTLYHSFYTLLDDEREEVNSVSGEGDTGAESKADLLIHLLESKLITVEEINSKL